MDFLSFCQQRGLLINELPPIGRWVRVATEDHPRKKNGSAKFMGDHGFAQNFATMIDTETWKPDAADVAPNIDHAAVARSIEAQKRKQVADQARAAEKARWILEQCQLGVHAYLGRKGFPEAQVNVWVREDAKIMVVPMRAGGELAGVQMIAESGNKKFLSGQKSREAVFVMGKRSEAPTLIVEGYATAMSVMAAMTTLKRPAHIVVCFSAFNVGVMAKQIDRAVLIADNDKPSQHADYPGGMGLKIARESGKPYWISDRIEEDFNDAHQRLGIFSVSQGLRTVIASA